MSETLEPRTALITGAAKRVGAAIARSLHGRGLRVAVHYRGSAADATKLAAELNAIRPGTAQVFQADLCRGAECRRLVAEVVAAMGGLDVLVNNASSFYPTPIGEVTEEAFDDLLGSIDHRTGTGIDFGDACRIVIG